MTERAYVVPRKDTVVIDYATGTLIPKEGMEIALDKYARRRIEEGDLTVTDPPKPARKNTPKEN